jgi:iron complex outermembrane receptor protein
MLLKIKAIEGWHYSLAALLCCSSAANAAEQLQQLDTLVVQSTAQSQGYQSQPSTAATKFALDQLDTPQNIQSVNAQLLADSNAQKIGDVIGLVSGVAALNPMGGLWDNYSIRGFNTDQTIGTASLRNGINANLGLSASRDMVNIEAIEFLKGPEAALYGAGDPGGSLNIITKKPQFSPVHQLSLRAGSYDQYRIALDSSNALTDRLAYRLGIAYDNNHSFRDFVNNERLFIAPQLSWQLSARTQIDYDSEYSFNNSLFDRGVLAVNQQLGLIPQSRFLGEPKDGLMDMDDYLQQLRIQHQFDNGWLSQSTLNFKDNSWRGYSSEAYQLLNSQGDLNRERRYRSNNSRSYLFDQNLLKDLNIAGLQHQLALGLSASDLEIDNLLLRYRLRNSQASLINIYDPEYGLNLPTPNTRSRTQERQQNLALYLSDYIHLNPVWSLLVGGRLDVYRQDYQNQSLSAAGAASRTSGQQDFEHFSPKLALNYHPESRWSIYASVGQSFHLNSGLDRLNQPFDPEQAWSYELGTKWTVWQERLSGSAAIFHIDKKNVLTADPADSAYSISAGEERSRGLELDLDAQPTPQLNLKLAYSYTDAYVNKSNTSSIPVGARLLNSPKHSGNVFVMYQLWQNSVGLGANWQYVAARSASAEDDGLELPSYSLLNLNAYYQINPQLRVQLTLNNALNKRYYAASYKDLWITPGHPRECFLSLDFKF